MFEFNFLQECCCAVRLWSSRNVSCTRTQWVDNDFHLWVNSSVQQVVFTMFIILDSVQTDFRITWKTVFWSSAVQQGNQFTLGSGKNPIISFQSSKVLLQNHVQTLCCFIISKKPSKHRSPLDSLGCIISIHH